MSLTVVVPTFNEGPNVAELVRRVGAAVTGLDAELVFVDDSTDDTPAIIEALAATAAIPVRLIHRLEPTGRLGGAVVEGISSSTADWCVVMDGDLQHPPELIPALLAHGERAGADVAVASRYCAGGDAGGLTHVVRRAVSSGSTTMTRAMFPRRLRECTDPMTGFFALRRDAVDLAGLRPRGFKILLEILARQPLRVVEEPFVFGARLAGESKATVVEGLRFARQLAGLRFGRMSRFAAVGALGTVANLVLMAVLLGLGTHYLAAAVVATEVTIVTNFLLSERLVFADLRHEGRSWWARFTQVFLVNNLETLARTPVLVAVVELTAVPGLLAQALTLAVAFVVRFTLISRLVYRPRRTTSAAATAVDTAPTAGSTPAAGAGPSPHGEPTDLVLAVPEPDPGDDR